MEQRPLRLGDILDDYCPRERRVTNHAIVAMIEDDVRQTRCTTCDAEHAYKGAKAPRTRAKKGSTAALYKEVLAGMPEADPPPSLAPPVRAAEAPSAEVAPRRAPEPEAVQAVVRDEPPVVEPMPAPAEHAAPPPSDFMPAAPPSIEEGPVHRPLIRATLPRIEGQKEARPIPDFTMRQPLARGRFRGGEGRMRFRGNGNGNGNGHGGGHGHGSRAHAGSRFGNQRPGGRRRRGR